MKKYLSLILIVIIAFVSLLKNSNDKVVTAVVLKLPSTTDPIHYDLNENHIGLTSVFSPLVSTYSNGHIRGVIAESWSHSVDFKVWTFVMRNNLYFSNKKKITAEQVALSFKRLVYLKKQSNSNSGLLEFLIGYEKFNNLDDNIKGLYTHNNSITFTFSKEMPELLNKLSFGLYSIVSSENYNDKNGKWVETIPTISSGPYQVTKMDGNDFVTILRNDYPVEFLSQNPIQKLILIPLTRVDDSFNMRKVDLMFVDKNSIKVTNEFDFHETLSSGRIYFIEVTNLKNKLLNSELKRSAFRDNLYRMFEISGLQIDRTFFTKIINNKVKIKNKGYDNLTSLSGIINIEKLSNPIPLKKSKNKMSLINFANLAFKKLSDKSDIVLNYVDKNTDIKFKSTGLNIVDPIDDIRFMFLSKNGIKLPDLSGKIIQELKKPIPNLEFIDEELSNQAIVWPIAHTPFGYWVNRNSKINMDDLNFSTFALDLQQINFN